MAHAAQDLAGLAVVPAWPADRLTAAGGRCHVALVTDWRTLVAPELAAAVVADLDREGLPLQADAQGRIAIAAWLRLHDHLAARLCDGDRVAFGLLWHQEVSARLPWIGRTGLRALGLRAAAQHLPRVWAAAFDVPAPQVDVSGDRVAATWQGHAIFSAPTFRWLIAMQGALLAPLCGGWPGVRVDAQMIEERFEITWVSREP